MTEITDASPWRCPPRISLDGFTHLLTTMGKNGQPNIGLLAERDPMAFYDVIRGVWVDPLYLLAVFWHESQFGTDGVARLTHSWGNTRTPNFGAKPIGNVGGASGSFPIWRDWLDGCISTVERLVSTDWVYYNRATIREIYDWPPNQALVWAPAGDHNDPTGYLRSVLDFMNAHQDQEVAPMSAQIPGFSVHLADSRHHGTGRAQKIHGFAVHFTDGSNSLDWLSTSPNSDVSATFLIKRHATLDDRGWQLVWIEDTPYTTGHPVNDYTVSFEYEHTSDQDIPDGDYLVMAQTIVDVQKYLDAHHDLGGFGLNRSNIKGHKEWVGDNRTCPDGIDVDALVARARGLASGASSPGPQTNERVINGFHVHDGFLGLYSALEAAGLHTQTLGLPLGDEIPAPFAGVDSCQKWERAWLVFQAHENPSVTVATRKLWPQLEALS